MKAVNKKDRESLQKFKRQAYKLDYTGFLTLLESFIPKYGQITKWVHLVTYFGISDQTLYNWCFGYDKQFGVKNDFTSRDTIKMLFSQNQTAEKLKMMTNWVKKDASPKLQIEAYKLLCQNTKEGKEELDIIQNIAVAEAETKNFTVNMPFSEPIECELEEKETEG